MATRPVWKGHLTFGLVNIPVTLYSAEQRNDVSLHLLDSENTQRVRYQRVNEDTGEEVPWDRIVKGYEYDSGRYVLLSKEEMKEIGAELTKRIEIHDFVSIEEIDPIYFDKPYYLEPGKAGGKSYALLREVLRMTDKTAIARVVVRAREHLAALLVRDNYLVLEMLRFPQELRSADFLEIPQEDAKETRMSQREIDLALQLVENMTTAWDPEKYHDTYRETLMDYINKKVERGELSAGEPVEVEDTETEEEENVVNLMDYLKKSVQETKPAPSSDNKKAKKKTASKSSSTAKKTASKAKQSASSKKSRKQSA